LHLLVRKQKQKWQRKAASHKKIGKEKRIKELTKTQKVNESKGLVINPLPLFCVTPSREKILLAVV
jgi:hypothetical protein